MIEREARSGPLLEPAQVGLRYLLVAGEGEEGGPLNLLIIGRPNAGKATLVNRMLGEERMITGPEAGITRDSITLDWQWHGRPVQLVDTAGRIDRFQRKYGKTGAKQ